MLLGAVPPREERILLAIFDYDVDEEKVRKGGGVKRETSGQRKVGLIWPDKHSRMCEGS